MPAGSFLQQKSDFIAILDTVAAGETINDPAMAEKSTGSELVFGRSPPTEYFEVGGITTPGSIP
jgi:hypothetical protein